MGRASSHARVEVVYPAPSACATPGSWGAGEPAAPYRVDHDAAACDEVAVSLAAAGARVAPVLARVAAAVVESRVAQVFGYARLEDYCRERHGRSGRWLRGFARLQALLEKHPGLRAAITGEDGGAPLHVSAAALIAEVATAGTLGAWVEDGRRLTLRQLEREVERRMGLGAPPGDAAGRGEGDGQPDGGAVGSEGAAEGGSARAGAEDAGIRAGIRAGTRTSGGSQAESSGDPGESATEAAGHAPLDDASCSPRESGDAVLEDDPSQAGPVAGGGSAASWQPVEGDRVEVRVLVPPAVRAAFVETLDLYRAVEGGERTVTSFVEALVAESLAAPFTGPEAGGEEPASPAAVVTDTSDGGASAGSHEAGHGRDPSREPLYQPSDLMEEAAPGTWQWLRHSAARDVMENDLAQFIGGWKRLTRKGNASWALRLAGSSLEGLDRIEKEAGQGDAGALDAQLASVRWIQNTLELRLGDVLLEMGALSAWLRLGFADVGHYAEKRLGISRTAAEQRQWLARQIKPFGLVRLAYERGELGWESTRVIVGILKGTGAGEEAQRAWIERGRTSTVKRLRDEARALQRVGALSRGVCAPRGAPDPMSDEGWHSSLRREPGSTCGWMRRFGAALVSEAESSAAQGRPMESGVMRLRLPADLGAGLIQAMSSRCRDLRRVARTSPDRGPWPASGESAALALTRIFSVGERRLPAWVALLCLLEECVEAWDNDGGARLARRRAEILARSGFRCVAPGCTGRRHLHIHHIRFRSRGGGEELANQDTVCMFHHLRGIHQGLAACRGEAPLGLTWRLGRSDVGEWFRNEIRLGGPAEEALPGGP